MESLQDKGLSFQPWTGGPDSCSPPIMCSNVVVPLSNCGSYCYFQSLVKDCMQQKKGAPEVQLRQNRGISV